MTEQERSDELHRLRVALHIAAHGDDEESRRALDRAVDALGKLLKEDTSGR